MPPLNINQVRSSVILRDAETVILGGIVTQQDDFSRSRTPGLSSIPLLGLLFQKDNVRNENTELMVAISPTIISDETGRIIRTVDPAFTNWTEESEAPSRGPITIPSDRRGGWYRYQGQLRGDR